MRTISVQHVGLKDPHEDNLYGTGSWAKGETKDIDRKVAPWLLHHDDVWRDARSAAARKKDPITPQKKPFVIKADERDVNAPAINIATLDSRGLAMYAKNTFNRDLDTKQPVETLRAEVRTLMRLAP